MNAIYLVLLYIYLMIFAIMIMIVTKNSKNSKAVFNYGLSSDRSIFDYKKCKDIQ